MSTWCLKYGLHIASWGWMGGSSACYLKVSETNCKLHMTLV